MCLCFKINISNDDMCFYIDDRHPMVTGTSVLGITFDGGVMIAADTLGNVCMCICVVCTMLVLQILYFILCTAYRNLYTVK